MLGARTFTALRLLKAQTISSVDIGTLSSGYELFKSVASIVVPWTYHHCHMSC